MAKLVTAGAGRLDQDLHYSSVVSVSRADAEVIRRMLMKSVSELNQRVNSSESEVLYGFCLDFFGM